MRICPECRQRTEERTCPSCRITTVDESAMSGQDLVGKVFVERYEVVEILGRGGMGAVYKARHLAMDSMVALKVLRREASGDLESIERFYREARSASRLQHPNTIRVFDFGQSEDGQLFLAMEYLDGRTLRSEVRRVGRMDEPRVLRIAEQVARSLGEAHGKGIVHRDVKPENVFLTEMVGHPDFVKVLDFGVARTMSNESLTRTGLAIGTPAYMSPEQARGEKVDGRSDLYSLGVMMFEMAAGIPPFESSTPMHLMLKHLSEPPPRLADVCGGGVTPGFEDLVQMLLAKAADDRPLDAEDLLDRITALKPVVATPRQTQATMHLGTEAPTPIRNGKTAFLGTEPSPTPTTPMGSIPADGGTGRGRPSTAAATADTSLLHEGPRSAGTAGPVDGPDGPRPGTPAGSRTVATPPGLDLGSTPGGSRHPSGPSTQAKASGLRSNLSPEPESPRAHPWIAPALVGATVALLLAGVFAWWFVTANGNGESGAAVVVTAGTASPAPGTPAPSPAPAPAPTPAIPAPTPAAEAPPATAPAATGTPPARAPVKARLSGTPDGAKVARLPDNAPLGRLPLDVEIPPGATVRVRLTAPGYRPLDLDLAWDDVKASPDRPVKLVKKAAASTGDGWDL